MNKLKYSSSFKIYIYIYFTLYKIPTTDIEKKKKERKKAQFYELGSDNKIFDRRI